MPISISVKNVPDDVAEKLRQRAARNHRSLQGEVLQILEQAASGRPVEKRLTVEEASQRIKALGIKTGDDATRLIREMRDSR